jgi:hypothetical protein
MKDLLLQKISDIKKPQHSVQPTNGSLPLDANQHRVFTIAPASSLPTFSPNQIARRGFLFSEARS